MTQQEGGSGMSYITWEQYSSLYDDIAEEQFSCYEVRAHRHIDMLTHGRVEQFMENMTRIRQLHSRSVYADR